MPRGNTRRQLLKAAAVGSGLIPSLTGQSRLQAAGRDVEVQISPVSVRTVRLTILPAENGALPSDGSLVQSSWGAPVAKLRSLTGARTVRSGNLHIKVASAPLTFEVRDLRGALVQHIQVADSGSVTFHTGDAPLLGLGEGGPQFDRRGSMD